jgi:Domain of unknown function (DUF4145)
MRDPDRLPTSADPTGPCPRCGPISNFTLRQGPFAIAYGGRQPDPSTGRAPITTERVVVLECPRCTECTVVIERDVTPPGAEQNIVGLHWWPAPGATDLDPDVPEPVGSAFSEGMRALSANCPRAASVMFRGMLAAVVRDKGGEAARQASQLIQQLKAMEREGTLHPSLVEWAAEIRLIGNAGAHPDELEQVDQAEAADLARLCRHLVTVVYETPARIRRARQQRPAP